MSTRGVMDVLICASRRDAGRLLSTALACLFCNLRIPGTVHLVTPDPNSLRPVLTKLPAAQRSQVRVHADSDVCPEAANLDPWFRQQYIKLHADRVATTRYVACLGADTLVLSQIGSDDLFGADDLPVLRYFRYPWPNAHLRFERERVLNVARMLCVKPCRSFLLGDFVCDLFVFDAELLKALRARLARGSSLVASLAALGRRHGADNRFGEWTSYAVFCLDHHPGGVHIRLAEPGFFGQVHSPRDLLRPSRYASRIVHFAWEPDNVHTILDDLRQYARIPAQPQ
jgi:hypothetical protein